MRVRFDDLSIAEQEVLTIALYSRADSWLGWGEGRESDNVLRSLGRIFQISMHGLKATALSLVGRDDQTARRKSALALHRSVGIDPALRVCPRRRLTEIPRAAQPLSHEPANSANPASCAMRSRAFGTGTARRNSANRRQLANPAVFPASITTPSLSPMPARRRSNCTASIASTPSTSRCRKPTWSAPRRFTSHYAFSPALIPQLSQLKLILNGTLFATIQPTAGKYGGSDGSDSEADFNIPPELLVHNNALTIEFIGHYTMICEDPGQHRALGARSSATPLSIFAATCCLWPTISSSCPSPSSIRRSFSPSAFPSSFPRSLRSKPFRPRASSPATSVSSPPTAPCVFRCTSAPFRRATPSSSPKIPRAFPPGLNLSSRQRTHRGHAHQSQRSLRQNPDRHRRQCRRRTRCRSGRRAAQ